MVCGGEFVEWLEAISDTLLGEASVVVEPERWSSGWEVEGFDGSGMGRGKEAVMLGSGALNGTLASTMETTIFSRLSEVICRLRLLAHESCRCILGLRMSTGAHSVLSSTASSSATESTLPDN